MDASCVSEITRVVSNIDKVPNDFIRLLATILTFLFLISNLSDEKKIKQFDKKNFTTQ